MGDLRTNYLDPFQNPSLAFQVWRFPSFALHKLLPLMMFFCSCAMWVLCSQTLQFISMFLQCFCAFELFNLSPCFCMSFCFLQIHKLMLLNSLTHKLVKSILLLVLVVLSVFQLLLQSFGILFWILKFVLVVLNVCAFFISQGSQLFMPSLCLMSKSYSWIIKAYFANFHVIVENLTPYLWRTITSPTSSFTFIILLVNRFARMEFWMQWIIMVNAMTFNTMMFTFFCIWSWEFGCRCFVFIWALLHVKAPQVQHTPWPCFVENDGEDPNWPPFWLFLALPLWVAIDLSFWKSFWVVMVTTNLPTSTTQNLQSIFYTMWNVSSNVPWPPWLMMNWNSNILCTYLSCLYMYNYINCCYVKTSLFSLINCANFMYMVCGGLSFSLWKS